MGDVGQIELQQANVRFPDSVNEAVDGADAVVNLVGVLFESGKQSFNALHVGAARTVSAAAAAQGVTRFVQMSSIGADAASPSVYARTKAEGEAVVRAAIPTATILRSSVVFGEEDQFFNRFAAMATMAPALPLIGGGKTLMQPIYAGDVGAAIANALTTPGALGGLYEIGGAKAYSFKRLMEIMLSEIHRRRALAPVPFDLAELIGMAGDVLAMIGLTPPLTTDQVKLLRNDNVVSPGAVGLADLGVVPTPLEAILPTYLWKYRSGGQFAQPMTANSESST